MELDRYSPVVQQLVDRAELAEFSRGRPRREYRDQLRSLDVAAIFPSANAVDEASANCCLAALWLANHFLDESHRISQAIDTPSGSFWHGIMHRREGDFWNAKYWFRKVGDHPAFAELRSACEAQLGGMAVTDICWSSAHWDPYAYVDLCQQAVRSGGSLADLCGKIARIEWLVLFDYCWRPWWSVGRANHGSGSGQS